MLPIFNNYTWIVILLAVMVYILKDWRKFEKFDVYTSIMYVSSFISGICVIDVLAGKPYLDKVVPNYMNTLLPASIVISIVCLFAMNFKEIKNSDQSDEEKQKNYRKQIKYIFYFVLICLWMYLRSIGISVLSTISNIFN